jgi:hypothetical protein
MAKMSRLLLILNNFKIIVNLKRTFYKMINLTAFPILILNRKKNIKNQ